MSDQHYLKQDLYACIRRDPALFELLQDQVVDGLACWDAGQPQHQWHSPALWKALGYEAAGKAHLLSEWHACVHPDDLATLRDELQKLCADPSRPIDCVVRCRHRDGSFVPLRWRAMPVCGPDGRVERVVSVYSRTPAGAASVADREQGQGDWLKLALDAGGMGAFEFSPDRAWGGGEALSNASGDMGGEYQRRLREALAGLSADAPGYRIEYRVDGGRRWIAESGLGRFDAEGRLVSVIGVRRDITGQRESERRLQYMLGATGDGVWDWSIAQDLVRHNLGWCRKLGLDETHLEHSMAGFMARVHEDDRAAVLERADACLRGDAPYVSEHRLRHADGSYIWVLDRGDVVERDEHGQALRIVGSFTDISAQKRVEKELRETEARFRATFDQAPIGIAHVDPVGHWMRVNQRLCDILGYSREELLQKSFQDVTHPDDLDTDLAHVACLLSGELSRYQLEKRYIRKDGATVWADLTVSLVHKADGTPDYFISVVEDTSARKALEAAARDSEARFRKVADTAPATLWLSDPEGGCSFVSRGWYELTGQVEGSALGRGWLEVVHPADHAAAATHYLDACSRRECFDAEFRIRRADGAYRWVLNAGRPRFGETGEFEGYVGSIIDITERKKAETALRESHAELARAQRLGRIGNWRLDVRTQTLTWSDELYGIFGMPVDAPLDLDAFMGCVHPDDRDYVTARWQAALAGEPYDIEHRAVVDGQVKWIREIAELESDEAGDIVSAYGIAQDITEKVLTRQELEAAWRAAERANDAKSRFLAAASHDLRQPLSALSLYVKVLDDHVGETGKTLLGNMRDSIVSLSELLTDLLDLSKLQAGVVRPNPVDFHVVDMLATLVSQHAPEAELRGLALRYRPSRLVAHTDAVLYRRVLGNLIDNAIRYTERGGVLVACRRRGGKWWVEVWDTGLGIPADKSDEIFEEFRQLGDQARTRGSGLGLAIVAKMAALLGVSVKVRSCVGRGSVFAIELPLGAMPTVVPDVAPEDSAPAANRERCIALVEDNVMVREALSAALESVGHEVFAAGTGGALLQALGGRAPDIVVSDYRLEHGETGFDVISAVREAARCELPAILVTGDTDPRLVRNMAARGIVVLHKPLDLDTLQAYIEDMTSQDVIAG